MVVEGVELDEDDEAIVVSVRPGRQRSARAAGVGGAPRRMTRGTVAGGGGRLIWARGPTWKRTPRGCGAPSTVSSWPRFPGPVTDRGTPTPWALPGARNSLFTTHLLAGLKGARLPARTASSARLRPLRVSSAPGDGRRARPAPGIQARPRREKSASLGVGYSVRNLDTH